MKHSPLFSSATQKLAIGSVLSLLAVSASQALLLTWDLRVVQTGTLGSSSGVVINDAHSATVLPGASVTLQLFAVFNDANAGGTDSLQFTSGSIASTASSGSFTASNAGSFRTGTAAANANNVVNFADASTATSGGNTADLSSSYPVVNGTQSGTTLVAPTAGGTADGILDLGDSLANAATGPTKNTGFFSASSGGAAFLLGAGVNSVLVGEFQLTLGPTVLTGGTTIGYYLRPRTTGTTATKFYNSFSAGGAPAAGFSYLGSNSAASITNAFAYNNVVLSTAVPEPSAFAMLALGALGIVGFRRARSLRTA